MTKHTLKWLSARLNRISSRVDKMSKRQLQHEAKFAREYDKILGDDGYTKEILDQAVKDAQALSKDPSPDMIQKYEDIYNQHGLEVAWCELWSYWTGDAQLADDAGVFYDSTTHTLAQNGFARLRHVVED